MIIIIIIIINIINNNNNNNIITTVVVIDIPSHSPAHSLLRNRRQRRFDIQSALSQQLADPQPEQFAILFRVVYLRNNIPSKPCLKQYTVKALLETFGSPVAAGQRPHDSRACSVRGQVDSRPMAEGATKGTASHAPSRLQVMYDERRCHKRQSKNAPATSKTWWWRR